MIAKHTKLSVIDNSGASLVKCFHIVKKGKNRIGGAIGDLIWVSVKRLKKSIPKKRVKKSDVVMALIVSARYVIDRPNGVTVKNKHNSVVILNTDRDGMISNRLVRPLFVEIRRTHFSKLITLAPFVI